MSDGPSNLFHLDKAVVRRVPPVDPPGGGGDDGGMLDRLAKLEAIAEKTGERLVSIEKELVRVEHSIRTELHKEMTAQTWRIISAMLAVGGLLSTAMYFIIRNTTP